MFLSIQSMDSSDLSDGPITLQEYLEVKKALASSEAKVQQLMKVNNNLSEELRRLQKEVGGVQVDREDWQWPFRLIKGLLRGFLEREKKGIEVGIKGVLGNDD